MMKMSGETIDIPKELEILNPEWQAKPILIGRKVHTLYPLTEGQAEKLSKTISKILYDIYTTDMFCPICKEVYKDALGGQTKCTKESCKGTILQELQQDAITAILGKGRLKSVLAELFKIPEVDIKRATVPQLKHIAGLLFVQNFSDESIPVGTEKNFQGLLNWMGIGTESREEKLAQSEQSMSSSRQNMDLRESISKELGTTED